MPTLAAVSIPVCTRLPRFARARRHSEQPWLSRRPPLPRAGLRSGTSRRGACGSPWRAPSGSCTARGTDRGDTLPRCILDLHHPAILNFIFVLVHCPRTPSVQSCRQHCRGAAETKKRKSKSQHWSRGVRGGGRAANCQSGLWQNMKLSIAGRWWRYSRARTPRLPRQAILNSRQKKENITTNIRPGGSGGEGARKVVRADSGGI